MSAVIPAGYKQTEVGVIPGEWEVAVIGKVFNLINGCPFKPSEWKSQGIPIIRIQNLNDPTATFNYSSTTPDERNAIAPGDLLFAWSGTTGSSFGARVWSGPAGVLNQHIFKVIVDHRKLTTSFAFLMFQKVQAEIEKQAHGFKTSFVHVKKADLVKVSLQVPPLPEQRAIATALSDIDTLLAKLDQLIAKKRDLKQAAMQQLLTGQTRLPGFSGEWEVKRLGDVADIDPDNLAGNTPQDYEFNYISLEDVDRGVLCGHSEQVFLTAPSRARRKLKHGDVLVSTVRPNLQSHLHFKNETPHWVCLTGFAVVRSRAGVTNSAYVFAHIFSAGVSRQIETLLTGSSYPAINSRDVRALEIPIPPYQEQTAIATLLSDMDTELAALEARATKTRALKQGMMQELLTGRIRLVDAHAASTEQPKGKSAEPQVTAPVPAHNWAFNEAVVIAVLVDKFGTHQYPLGRMRYTKLSYLMHRKAENDAQGYLKKKAGPYNPQTRYAGPEKIATQSGYMRDHTNGKYKGWVASDKIEQARTYFDSWYGTEMSGWLEQFRYKSKDELERLATVDMAMKELAQQNKPVDVNTVRMLIESEPEWAPKLTRDVFSNEGIATAMAQCRTLFQS